MPEAKANWEVRLLNDVFFEGVFGGYSNHFVELVNAYYTWGNTGPILAGTIKIPYSSILYVIIK
jgi:hypothetical protein